MNWAWATSLDHIWRSPALPMWLTLAAAGFFGVIVLITLLRAEKSVANGALTVIALLAIGIAVAAPLRGFGPPSQVASADGRPTQAMTASPPALSCIDDLAGDIVLAACEKALFGSAETAAAAVSYAAAQLARLTALGDVATAETIMTPELLALHHAVERDRYGLVAQVLLARDHCTPTNCAAFRSLTDYRQIAANMDERVYDGLVAHYAPLWNAPAAAAATAAPVAALGPSLPTGKPTNADFPSAASTPPVSIMTPEPGTTPTPSASPRAVASTPAANANAPLPSPRPAAAASALASAKKQAAPKPSRPGAPVHIAPETPTPAASND